MAPDKSHSQCWWYVNIDKSEATACVGSMGEFFFSPQSPTSIIELLAIPANDPVEHEELNEGAGSWAGDRILCVGQYTTIWPFESDPVDKVTGKPMPPPEFMSQAKVIETYSTHRRKSTTSIASFDATDSRVWVLRNLDKKLYIRSNGIPSMIASNRPGLFAAPGLGSVLLGRIGWSEDSECGMNWDEDTLHQGEWVGCRLDVRLFDEVKDAMITDGWIDDTDTEAERTRDIWMSEHRTEYTDEYNSYDGSSEETSDEDRGDSEPWVSHIHWEFSGDSNRTDSGAEADVDFYELIKRLEDL